MIKPPRRVRHVAGRPSLRLGQSGGRQGKRALLLTVVTWPFRSGRRLVSSIAVAALTALAVGYVVSRQDVVFDALNQVSGSYPILIHPFQPDVSFVSRPWALPATLPPERVSHSMNQQDFREIVTSSNAVPLGAVEVELTMEGNRHESVIIESIAARVLERVEAPNGTFISGPNFGGPNPRITLGFALDKADRRARIPNPDGTLGEIFGKKDYLEIRKDEKLVFSFHGVTTMPYLYRWTIELALQVGEQRYVMTTTGQEAPYMVAGPVDAYSSYYDRGGWQIEPSTADRVCPGGCSAMASNWAKIHG